MPECLSCHKEVEGSNLCTVCAHTLPSDWPKWKQVKVDQKPSATPRRTGTEVALGWFLEEASKIESSSDSTLANQMEAWVGYMCIYLDSRNYWNASEESSVGDQHTPENCKTGTTSLDFQGVRSGSEGTFWIDLQGQVGGGGTKRKSYCQVLIQTRLGGPVPPRHIVTALVGSLKGGKKRAVIHREGEEGRPK